MKKLFAIVLAVAVLVSSFVISVFAANVYEDKDYFWEPGDGCEAVASVSSWTGTGEYGTYPTRKGVILVTEDSFSIVPNGVDGEGIVGHVAIVYSSTQIVHAYNVDENGNEVKATDATVVMGKNNWKTARKGGVVGLAVASTSAKQDREVADWCEDQVGTPYALWPYQFDRRDKFYCSHLIYAGFLDNTGVDLNANTGSLVPGYITPYELINSPETYLIYALNWSQN